ncbi:hypothetical protein GOP47_0020436 [Adiantum capillus-veneris]|uniref:Aminopeptidase n=1 Tax=Adiantum capillus-veneris TaxID=13818 RepID=A0A9D4ZAM0_ADICA|nr:hypothetical protein GOP47_0020152 [Adiantum capillus-veneris]KAI5065741.1 hypothetical protein GOP47_0020436 [Adiantum capillus-veneris]
MGKQSKGKKKEIMRIERESVIMTMKPRLVMGLADLLELDSDREEFLTLCKRIDSTIRAWYHQEFEEIMQLYSLFDPVHGTKKLEQQSLSPARVDSLEQQFIHHLFKIMEKSNYKLLSEEEVEIATSGQYLLNLPIAVDSSKLDSKLFSKYFADNPRDGLPTFANQYALFRQGIGMDRTTDYFVMEKIDSLISRFWDFLVLKLRLRRLFSSKQLNRSSSSITRIVDSIPDAAEQDLYVERIRIENLNLSFKDFLRKTTVQEPTFERMILIYRRATPPKSPLKYGDRAIHIKQFRNIPMADMELVLPEKKNPGLTPMDWAKLLISAGLGLVTLVTSLEMPKADFWVVSAILGAVIGYCVKIFLSFQQNLIEYQNLITRSMYEKQLDSGRGTLLHMCDDMIQQEVKEVILAYFVLISQGRATKDDLDRRCEELMVEEFQEKCDFEVEDAVKKMERLGIVSRDSVGRYCHVPLKRANEIIGSTTEERVSKALV